MHFHSSGTSLGRRPISSYDACPREAAKSQSEVGGIDAPRLSATEPIVDPVSLLVQ